MNQTFMKEKPIFPLVLSMALPMTISMLVNALYNIVDSYFVASISESAMTALSLVYPIQNIVTAVTVGFGIGINALVAFFLGADDKHMANRHISWNAVQFYSRNTFNYYLYFHNARLSWAFYGRCRSNFSGTYLFPHCFCFFHTYIRVY